MVLLAVFCLPSLAAEASGDEKVNRFNVVMVTDASGSMSDTDPEGYRYEAINLFVALLANGGNHVGSVVFSNDVSEEQDPVEVTGRPEKTEITDGIQGQEVGGWTDIGGALEEAVDMLEEDGDENLPSIIVLLTDGNTEMGTEEETQESIAKKEEALEEARESGCQIYTICLNQNQQANPDELRQIAQATGGQFREVQKAEDLQDVFDLYYQMIFSTQSVKLAEETIPESGVVSRDFDVAELGVEEINMVVFGEADRYVLRDPQGHEYTEEELAELLYSSRTFDLLKISQPQSGQWHLDVYGTPGSQIEIFKIYNSNLSATTHIRDEQENYIAGTPVEFVTELYEGGQKVTDMARYAGYKAVLEVTDFEGNVLDTVEVDQAGEEGFVTSFTPADYGTFYATLRVENEGQVTSGGQFTLNVGNTPPAANVEVLEKHINIWPFLIPTDSTIDLSEAASDAEDASLNYQVESSSWLEDDYTLEGSQLTINNFSVSRGSFTIQAYDSQGAYCTFEVKVTSTNIGILALILMLGGGLLVLIILLILLRIALGKAFMGSITAENLETRQESTITKNRGRVKITMFQIGATGLHKKSYFQATGKSYIYFVSKKPVYADNIVGKAKKIRLNNGEDVYIYVDAEHTRGIRVRFDSVLQESMY